MSTENSSKEHKDKALSQIAVSRRLYLDGISIELYSNDSDEDYRIDINVSNINREAILNKEQAVKLYEYLGTSLNVWFLSGDDGEDSLVSRLKSDLDKL